MNVPSVFRLFYLAFRMGPFLVVLYFMLYALLRQDFTYLIYLMGVVMACFFGILTGGLWTSRIKDPPETVCHPLRLGTGERLSVLPLSIVVYVFTLCYFSVPIFQKQTQSENVMFITSFVLLIFLDILWLQMFDCSSLFRIVVAGTVGITVGLSWGQIVYDLKLTSFMSQGRDNSCLLPTPVATADASSGQPEPKYICVRRKRIEYVPVGSKAKEGMTTMMPTPTSETSSTNVPGITQNPTSTNVPGLPPTSYLTDEPYMTKNPSLTYVPYMTINPSSTHVPESNTSSVEKAVMTSTPPLIGPTVSPNMMKLLSMPPSPPPATSPPPPFVVSTIRSLCTQAASLLQKQKNALAGQENQAYVATLYENLTFHQDNISTLITALNTESSDTITDRKRIDYYSQFNKTMLQNAVDSMTQLQSVEANMDPTLYAQFNKTFMALGKLFRQLPS
jgi:hypothetical protein